MFIGNFFSECLPLWIKADAVRTCGCGEVDEPFAGRLALGSLGEVLKIFVVEFDNVRIFCGEDGGCLGDFGDDCQ